MTKETEKRKQNEAFFFSSKWTHTHCWTIPQHTKKWKDSTATQYEWEAGYQKSRTDQLHF